MTEVVKRKRGRPRKHPPGVSEEPGVPVARQERSTEASDAQPNDVPWSGIVSPDAISARSRRVAMLPPDARERVETLSGVASVYIKTGRDMYLDRAFRAFIELILSDPGDGKLAPGKVLFVTGKSGAGKSRAVRAMLERSEVMKPDRRSYGLQVPWVSVTLGGGSSLKRLAHSVLKAAGYPISTERKWDVWDLMNDVLAAKEIFVVHIDETQHLVRQTEKDHSRKELADSLKKAMAPEPWPVSFILSGLPETTRIAALDEQFERRELMVSLPSLVLPDDREVIESIIRKMCDAAGLSGEDAIGSDLPERLAHSAADQFGRVCDGVFLALRDALARKSKVLTAEHFRNAFDLTGESFSDPSKNPFWAANWRDLKKGSFIGEAEGAGDA